MELQDGQNKWLASVESSKLLTAQNSDLQDQRKMDSSEKHHKDVSIKSHFSVVCDAICCICSGLFNTDSG